MRAARAQLAGFGALALVGLAFLWQAQGLTGVSNVFPRAAIASVLALCALNALLLLRRPDRAPATPVLGQQARAPFTRGVAIAIGAAIAYVAAIGLAGFYVSTATFLALLYNWRDAGSAAPSARAVGLRLVLAVAVTAALYAVFAKALMVQTPRGLFF